MPRFVQRFQWLLLLDGGSDRDVLDAIALWIGEEIGNCDTTDLDGVGRIAFIIVFVVDSGVFFGTYL
ncbi:hypothetical protein U1Q18_016686, partial [Sarracenia purpurea var. burkii]